MSKKSDCEVCPFNYGFDVGEAGILSVCGTPSEACAAKQDKLIDQVIAWRRFRELAKNASDGILRMGELLVGDVVTLHSSLPGRSLNESYSRRFSFEVVAHNGPTLIGTVIRDTFNDSADLGCRIAAAMPQGQVEIIGAFDKQGEDDSGLWYGGQLPGELHRGKFVSFNDVASENSWFAMCLQEIDVINPERNLGIPVFGSDWSKYYGPTVM